MFKKFKQLYKHDLINLAKILVKSIAITKQIINN